MYTLKTVKKLNRRQPQQRKTLMHAIAHRQKTLSGGAAICLFSSQGVGETYLWEWFFIDIKS